MDELEHLGRKRQQMNMQEQRRIAMGAVRSQLRHMGFSLESSVAFDDAMRVLDDFSRSEPELLASQWYANASDNQMKLLRREWQRQFAPTRRRSRPF